MSVEDAVFQDHSGERLTNCNSLHHGQNQGVKLNFKSDKRHFYSCKKYQAIYILVIVTYSLTIGRQSCKKRPIIVINETLSLLMVK